jgi:diguanylate cyclase (GGDEF)-like protein/PAS domain S-box-containing protein
VGPEIDAFAPRSRTAAFAHAWAAAIAGSSYVSMSTPEIESLLVKLSERLAHAIRGTEVDRGEAAEVGAELVRSDFADGRTLGQTLLVIGRRLAADVAPELSIEEAFERVSIVQGALAAEFARSAWLRTLDQQEQIRAAYLHAKEQAQEAMRVSEGRFRAVFDGAGIAIAIASVDGTVLEINPVMAEMLGAPTEMLVGSNVMQLLDGEDAALWHALAGGMPEHVRFEKGYVRPGGGAPFWVDITIELIRDQAGTPSYVVVMGRDITQRHLLAQRLQHEATHDPLTNLPNRTLFFDWLDAIFQDQSSDNRVGLCFLDLDGFKVVNDTLGHDTGDKLLTAVAASLQLCVDRLGHRVARLGGDEFVVLVRDSTSVEQLIAVADELLATLRHPLTVAGHRLSVSASIGIVERPVRATTMAELLRAADVTLYWAKTDGRGRWTVFDPDRNARQVARYALSSGLSDGLARHEFFLEYQPLVRLSDSALIGVEALARWRHPSHGRLAPDSFIGLAEETGLIVPLGAWVLREACEQARRWQVENSGEAMYMSVNLAARQAHSAGIVDDVARILDETGLKPELLQLELTESAVMGTAEQTPVALRRLSDMGVRIAIDDFGTGYSNLAYLRHLPVHSLKLAGSFVEGLRTDHADPVDEQLVATLIHMAHTLGLGVTAENVETAAQADRLRDLGCDVGQGFYYARPVAGARIARLLDATAGGTLRLPSRRP